MRGVTAASPPRTRYDTIRRASSAGELRRY